ncbi:MAG: hypothetical protein HN778_20635 [Prolixibacteraceae bacterium]|nr:hypothetical protein [Prolixibacteraceae bacterium]MBT6766486.1 hypothetical protein [Prolixibacteraceae bacterium]MBT7000465.1 hypothetical protein [Prolixibacteraceae bacterium]MBT7397242.1 hypothetical protein [Prolixibacteraceae bacterium]
MEEAGTHASLFPGKFQVFTDLLEEVGYELGFTGKPWGSGDWKRSGWDRNPVGPEYNEMMMESIPAMGCLIPQEKIFLQAENGTLMLVPTM